MVLYYFFPYKNQINTVSQNDKVEKKLIQEITPVVQKKVLSKKEEIKEQKQSKLKEKKEDKKLVPKNGIDYVKHDNFVFKRVWEDGILIKETKLAPTIKESRKKEKIPQFAVETI